MRTLLLTVVLLFPLMSGITSVIMAGPAIDEPVVAFNQEPAETTVAMSLAR